MAKQLAWGGLNLDLDRPVQVRRPCSCGCDERDGCQGVGYITGGGFTLWIEEEPVYQAIRRSFEAQELEFDE